MAASPTIRRLVLAFAGTLLVAAVGAAPLQRPATQPTAPTPRTVSPVTTPPTAPARPGLPALTDAEFWSTVTRISEPDGTFHSENLVSNEARFQQVIPDLIRMAKPGRAYVGVGSEQNFSYIAAVRPTHAFILDIRRGNLDLHLLYKAFFETSATRADFVSKVFARPRPAGLTERSTAAEIFAAFETVAPSQPLFDATLKAAITHLTQKHGFALSAGDRDGMAYVYNAWYTDGPDISYRLNTGGGRGGFGGGRIGGTTYASLMTATDGAGVNRSYLATEDAFRFLKDLHMRNRIIPVVGNFGGPKALRAVGTYLKQQQMVVSAFYASNVQQYLRQDGLWNTFCASAATLPMDATTTLIYSERGGFQGARAVAGGGFQNMITPLAQVVATCSGR